MATAVKEAPKDHMFSPQGEYALLHVSSIAVEKGFNNRRDLGDLTELSESIKSVGVLEPLIVYLPEGENRSYYLIAGERRLAAAKKAGLTIVPAIIRTLNERDRLEVLIVENLQRKDIDPLEEADGYKRLLAFGLKQQDIAAKVGRSPAHVSKRLSLLELPIEARQLVETGVLAIADALEFVPYVTEPTVIATVLSEFLGAKKNGYYFRLGDSLRQTMGRLERDRKRTALIEKLKAEKVSVIKTDSYGTPAGVVELGRGYRQLPMTPAEHSKQPCHAAWVDGEGRLAYVCTKIANHKESKEKAIVKAIADIKRSNSYNAPSRGDGKAAKEQAKKAAESRERNKVLRIREPLRTAELKRLLTARQKREDVLDFLLRQLLQRFIDESPEVANLTAQILELPMPASKRNSWEQPKVNWAAYISGGNDRLFKLAYTVALASGEWPYRMLVGKGFFDQEFSTNAERYVEHLKANGYAPDKVEKAQLTPANRYRYRPAFDKARGKEKP